jgi:hypothetical protein
MVVAYAARAAGDKDLRRQIVKNGIEADAHLQRIPDEQENYAEKSGCQAEEFSDRTQR